MEKTKLLIVEDNAIVAEDLKSKLINLGYDVIAIAYSGKKALTCVENQKPDIVLMDINLGKEIDGVDTASKLKFEHEISVIYLTAHADDDTISRAKITEPYGYIIKPFDDTELKSVIEIAVYKQRVDRKLIESEDRFKSLFEYAPLPYQSLDENGNFLEVNRTWLDILKYKRSDVIGKSFGDFLHPEWIDHFKENFPKFKTIGEVLGVEFKMKKGDGTFITTRFDGKIRKNQAGDFIQTHCVFKDISEEKILKKKLEKQEIALRQSQKMEAIGNLAGGNRP